MTIVTVTQSAKVSADAAAASAAAAAASAGAVAGNAMAATLFTAISSLSIPSGVDAIRTGGHTVKGVGAALYVSTSNTGATAYRTQTANGRWFELQYTGVQAFDAYGAVGNGDVTNPAAGTSDQAAFDAAVEHMNAHGGGVLKFGAKVYKLTSITFPYVLDPIDTPARPQQRPFRLSGVGGFWNTDNSPAPVTVPFLKPTNLDGTILLLTAASGVGKIDTRGAGFLGIDNLTLYSGSTAGVPFIQTTHTHVQCDYVTFWGAQGYPSVAPNEDAVVCGGTSTALDNTSNAAFQGYGSSLRNCFFQNVRRGIYGRTFCNGLFASQLTFWLGCGNTTGGAIEFDGGSSTSAGHSISDVLAEVTHYKHIVNCVKNVSRSTFLNIKGYDPNPAVCVSAINYKDSTCSGNLAIGPFMGDGVLPGITQEANENRNWLLSFQVQDRAMFPRLTVNGGDGGMVVQPVDQYGSTTTAVLFSVLRSALEVGGQAGAIQFQVLDGKGVKIRQAGGVTNPNETCIDMDKARLDIGGTKWIAPGVGQGMEQNSGTGGSYLDLKNFGVRFYSHTGALQGTWGAGKEGIAFGSSGDVSLARASAGVLKCDHKLTATDGIGVGNSAAATTLGTLSKKMEVFDASGASLGFVPIYTTIT